MANLDMLLKALDSAHWELSEAFRDLPDEDVWRRADPRLLSVGELAAHIVYWEAHSFLGPSFESPMISDHGHYYTLDVDKPFRLEMSSVEVMAETKRVHEACKEALATHPHDSAEPNHFREGWTWGYVVEYQIFHVAYHTGQIYSARHLLGHSTPDN